MDGQESKPNGSVTIAASDTASQKIEIVFDSTSLGWSHCDRKFYFKVYEGYKEVPKAPMVYGTAMHKFVDSMYKTNGRLDLARVDAEKAFNIQKLPPASTKPWQADTKHFNTSCFNVWNDLLSQDSEFDLIQIPVKCYFCKGSGVDRNNNQCNSCSGSGIVDGPASEVNFKIKIYEDDKYIFYLAGTIDGVGQFHRGIFAIRDFKFTSFYDKEDYLSDYELNRQLRIYHIACRLEARNNPDSILGKLGASKMGAFIQGVFLKARANDNEYMKSEVFTYEQADIDAFERQLLDFCKQFASNLSASYYPKRGILNGTCNQRFGRCEFWNVCKANPTVAGMLLGRDFLKVKYDPLNFGGE